MSEFDALVDGYDGVASHGMTVGDQSTADALDEILGPSVENPLEVSDTTLEEPPHEPDDWPEPPPEVELFTVTDDLRVLHSDRRPEPGKHYVVFGGKPTPVVRAFAQTEDEFVRSQMDPVESLKDPDGQRRVRADRTLRMRYRGYVSGEMSSL